MELSLLLPQGNFILKKLKSGSNDFIVAVAGGRKPDINWFKQTAAKRKIYCADKGIEICLDSGLVPELLCGDADSTGAAYLKKAEAEHIKKLLFNPAKDDTDLQLLLKNLLPENVVVTGIWGGRFDHLYSNVFSLYNHKENNSVAVIMADSQELMVLLSAGESLEFYAKADFTALSLLPLKNSIVSLSGARWSLKKAELLTNYPYAVSNEITDEKVTAVCHSGCIGFYLKTAGQELL